MFLSYVEATSTVSYKRVSYKKKLCKKLSLRALGGLAHYAFSFQGPGGTSWFYSITSRMVGNHWTTTRAKPPITSPRDSGPRGCNWWFGACGNSNITNHECSDASTNLTAQNHCYTVHLIRISQIYWLEAFSLTHKNDVLKNHIMKWDRLAFTHFYFPK